MLPEREELLEQVSEAVRQAGCLFGRNYGRAVRAASCG